MKLQSVYSCKFVLLQGKIFDLRKYECRSYLPFTRCSTVYKNSTVGAAMIPCHAPSSVAGIILLPAASMLSAVSVCFMHVVCTAAAAEVLSLCLLLLLLLLLLLFLAAAHTHTWQHSRNRNDAETGRRTDKRISSLNQITS